MSCMTSATLMTKGVNPWIAAVFTLVCCLIIGVLNGILVAYFKLPPFIATLGTMTVARGIAQIVNGNYNTDAVGDAADGLCNFFYYGKTLGIFNAIWIAAGSGQCLTSYCRAPAQDLLLRLGSSKITIAIGSNIDAARLSGVNVVATTIKAYLVASFMACVVGLNSLRHKRHGHNGCRQYV